MPGLARALDLPLESAATDFPLLVPLPYLARIRRGDPRDPLLLQVLPDRAEALSMPGYTLDPTGEQSLSGPRGMMQKYAGRALILAAGSCAVNCRYCFRRHYPYGNQSLSQQDWQQLFNHLKQDSSIHEVILSGGDPLMLNDRQLKSIVSNLEQIEQIDTLRFHTRLPVVIPQRICEELLNWVAPDNKQMIFVTHINHPNEIDEAVSAAMQRLASEGVKLLNQSVLLHQVNDNADTLIRLSRKLFACGVLPYYLHLLDPVAGAGHFDVPETVGHELISRMTANLPGYLVPRLAREVPGADAKKVVA